MLGHGKMEMITRLGFAARAVMYVLLGWIALRTGRGENAPDVLEYIQGGSGRILLGIMAIGFFGYGLWRLGEAVIDSEGHGRGAKGAAVRLGGAVSGIVHFGLGVYAVSLAAGERVASGGSGAAAEVGAATTLELPGGPLLLAIAAAALLATGGYQLVKAVKGDFLKYLHPDAARRPWIEWIGRAGYAARGLVFLMVGWTVWRAAREDNADRAGDMGSALDLLAGPLHTLVAAGLLLFGAFSFIEAIYRRITNPDVLRRLRMSGDSRAI